MTTHQETLQLANGPALWVFCALTIGVVLAQVLIFLRVGKRYANPCGITRLDVRRSVKAGMIATIGPSLSVFVVALGLLNQIGTPLTLARFTVMGNSAYEASSAEMAAAAMGTSISADSYSAIAFTASVWVMNLGGICMILMTLLLLKPLDKLTNRASHKTHKGMLIGLSASLASFGYFAVEYSHKDLKNLTAVLSGFGIMLVLQLLGKMKKINWLREWGLTIAIILAVCSVMIFF